MADKERIMSLEGQNSELCDRVAELEHEKMLREVADEEILQSKAYELAQKMAKDMLEEECDSLRVEETVHARRKYKECDTEIRIVSLMAKSFYANNSITEKQIAEEGLTGKKNTSQRKELEKPIWKAFVAWALAEHAKAVDGSAVKGALGYFLERRKELQMYLKYPEMPFTNNDCERQIREMVMGRKNYLFCQNHLVARRAAMMYSFFGTCKLQGKNPEKWLTYVLEHIKTTPADQIYRLLPQYWNPNKVIWKENQIKIKCLDVFNHGYSYFCGMF